MSTQKKKNRGIGIICSAVVLIAMGICSSAEAQWKAADGPLMTRWSKEVSPANAHREYPRPQMVRKGWLSLNGLWDYAISAKEAEQPASFDGEILVPFAIESALSGVMKKVGFDNRLWYRRSFEVPKEWSGKRVLLHFGAVDWDATVLVNGKKVGAHKGGYDAFNIDVTEALKEKGSQEIIVSVWDPSDKGTQARGKQVSRPRGIWYTSVTGIWQSVWLEGVNSVYIKSLKIVPDVDNEFVRIKANCSEERSGLRISVEAKQGDFSSGLVTAEAGKEIILPIKEAKLWSPDSPFLYDLDVKITDTRGEKVYDSVRSYFGMRKISVEKDKNGINRLFLNGKCLFQYGPLDQGWWPDGLYTAPTDDALKYDIIVLKELGCNMMRKHVKIEPDRFYYWCDKLGLLVWQDMPNGDKHIRKKEADVNRGEDSSKQFEKELRNLVEGRGNHPSIIMWVAFNEGWGQYDTARIVNLIKGWDRSRLVNNASGWADRGVGDVHDVHKYPGPIAPPNSLNRAAVLGEFGGLGLPIKGHTWQDEANWGYRKYESSEELTKQYLILIDKLEPLVQGGLAAAVYTQTTDVEIEVNGLMTYDREMIKMDADKIKAANKKLTSFVP
ncbi:MAG: glycoside hydrolase family 2 protein [Planctomycetota bacterium]